MCRFTSPAVIFSVFLLVRMRACSLLMRPPDISNISRRIMAAWRAWGKSIPSALVIQQDLVVLVSPGAAHCLSVKRDFPLGFPAFPGPREKPRAGYQVQLGRVDPGQHVPYGRFARVLVAEPEPAPFSAQLPQQRLGNVGC